MAVTCEEPCRLDTGGAVVASVAEVPAHGAGPGMSRLGLILFLGALCAIGPLAIDMYLPSFPRVASDLGVPLGLVERTLAVYFIGLAFGQLLYGPISDRLGRKTPLYLGLGVFTLASVGCALATGVEMLIAVRFCQALGGCALMVVARAVVRDLFGPRESARVFSSLILVMGVTPILAPLLGGWLAEHAGWRAIFWFQAAAGIACLGATGLFKESHPPHRRARHGLGVIGRSYLRLLRDRQFVAATLTGGFLMMGMFAYVSGSPGVFIGQFGVRPEHFGLYFGANAAGFIAASQVNARILRRADPRRSLRAAVWVAAASGSALLVTVSLGVGGFAGVLVPIFVFVTSMGFVLPTATALALAAHGREAGNASAVLGFLQFSLSACGGMLVSAVHTGSALPMAAVIGAGGLASLAASRLIGAAPVDAEEDAQEAAPRAERVEAA